MADDALGGYRLVRRLGEGDRADVYLGHPMAQLAHADQTAVKIYRPHVEPSSIAREIEAISAARGPHVVRLLDLAVTADRSSVLILERLGPRRLSDILSQRGELDIGEATTILVPLARALSRMHDAGIAHGRVAADAVLFTSDGAPVFSCFGSAVVTGATTRASRDETPEFSVDRASFVALAGTVLDAARAQLSSPLEDLMHSPTWAEDFAARMFALGPAAPIELSVPPADHAPALHPVRRREYREKSGARGLSWRIELVMTRLRELTATVRPRFWLIGGGALAALVAGLVMVPESSTDATSSPAIPDPTTPATSAAPIVDREVTGDDPLVALQALLTTRDECVRAASILCLDAVNQPGSAAMASDQDAIRAIQDGASLTDGAIAELPAPPWQLDLEEQLGGAALVTVSTPDSEPASILMIRSEAGWRIREYL